MQQNEAIIRLATSRNCIQNEEYRSYNSIFEDQEFTANFTDILRFEDITLAALKSKKIQFSESQDVFVLPLVGTLDVAEYFVEISKMARFSVKKEEELLFRNPYKAHLINFLLICLKTDKQEKVQIEKFNFLEEKNKLHTLFSGKLLIGNFTGRAEITHQLLPHQKTFIFVINGAFEVQYRLLEARDSLALWNTETIEIEGLAPENSILLLVH